MNRQLKIMNDIYYMNELCVVCFNDFEIDEDLKYNCTVCAQLICNECFSTHIKTSTRCIFCRGQLDLTNTRISTMINDRLTESENFIRRRNKYCWCMCFLFFMIYTTTILVAPSEIEKQYNTTSESE